MLKTKSTLKCISFAVVVSLILSIVAALGPSTAYASNSSYYFSSSTGNDSTGNGSISSPWKTLSRISSMTFQPGDTIFLKRGDTWNETVTLNGNSSSASPITLTSYGSSGDRPYIIGPDDNSSACITIPSGSQGWSIQNIEMGYAKYGINIVGDTGVLSTKNYYDIANCYIHNCVNRNWGSSGADFTNWGRAIGTEKASGSQQFRITNMSINNCILDSNDTAYFTQSTAAGVSNLTISGCTISNGKFNQVTVTGGSNCDMINCMFDHNGTGSAIYGLTSVIYQLVDGGAGVNVWFQEMSLDGNKILSEVTAVDLTLNSHAMEYRSLIIISMTVLVKVY